MNLQDSMQCYGFNYYPYKDDSQLEKKKTTKQTKNTFNPLLSSSSRFRNENVEKSAFPELSFFSLSTPIPITIIALQFSISVKVTANQFRDPINLPPSPYQFKQLLNLLNFLCFLPLFTSLLLLLQFRSHCLPTRFQK